MPFHGAKGPQNESLFMDPKVILFMGPEVLKMNIFGQLKETTFNRCSSGPMHRLWASPDLERGSDKCTFDGSDCDTSNAETVIH